jgi:hypothetical protein
MTTNLTGPTSPQYTLEDSLTGLKITWQGKKDWGRFSSAAFTILINLFVAGVILWYADIDDYRVIVSQTATLILIILMGAYVIYRIVRKTRELMAALLDHEIIQIDNQTLTIERSGFLNIDRELVYPADKIQSIRASTSGFPHGLYPVFTVGGDALTRYRLGVDQVFCRGINADDAGVLLGKIHARFPQYRDVKS